jgi:hypothetical protein
MSAVITRRVRVRREIRLQSPSEQRGVHDAIHGRLTEYLVISGLSSRIRTCRQAQRLRVSYSIAHGSQPRARGISASAIVRPSESP